MSKVHHSHEGSMWLPEERAADYLSAAAGQYARISRRIAPNLSQDNIGYGMVSFYLATPDNTQSIFEAQLIDDLNICELLPRLTGNKLRYVQISHHEGAYDLNIQRSSRMPSSLANIPPDRLMELAVTDVSLHESAASEGCMINAMPVGLACELDAATAAPGVMRILDKIGQVVRFIERAQYVKG